MNVIPLFKNLFAKATPKRRGGSARVDDPNGSSNGTGHTETFAIDVPEIPKRLLRLRKITIEPKVPLANERTFLAWMNWATFLSGASMALASLTDVKSDPLSQIVGLLFLPLSIGVIIYSLHQCK